MLKMWVVFELFVVLFILEVFVFDIYDGICFRGLLECLILKLWELIYLYFEDMGDFNVIWLDV